MSISFDGLTLWGDEAATTTGMALPDSSNIRNIQQLSLNLTGNNNSFYATAGGSSSHLTGTGNAAYAGAGSDYLYASDMYITPGGQDTADGDWTHVDYSTATAPVRMDSITTCSKLNGYSFFDYVWIGGSAKGIDGSLASVTLLGSADVIGSDFADVLVGHLFVDDNGHLYVGPPVSTNLHGGGGDDIVTPGIFDAALDGGSGIDTLTFANPVYGTGNGGGVTIDLGVTTAQASGYGVYTISGFENVTGSANDDQLRGDALGNVLIGGAGDDQLHGNGGNDVLIDGSGSNILDGGGGGDTAVYGGFSGRYAVSMVRRERHGIGGKPTRLAYLGRDGAVRGRHPHQQCR